MSGGAEREQWGTLPGQAVSGEIVPAPRDPRTVSGREVAARYPGAENQVFPYPAERLPRLPSPPPVGPPFNPAAAVAMAVAVIFPPAGLGLAKSARRECLAHGSRGAGLALAAHLVAAIGTLLWTLVTLAICAAGVWGINVAADALHTIGDFLEKVGSLF
ncbi:hypothetical protein Val02_32220 [Virgisporangium aliadipatigenens]|uniref:DUF4190 domain-containing protein n=1 Tax=Virgisporangium aliadipatigenens TaxID=741659 RepID=A0A8J3YJK9_9ACTN|nr:hypothetical protein [Virgisporangium aliadipatigenens]GIJ46336.1 hypothetical protein Val02_32220 [Virgisporangium aliadipatigenens]